MGYVARVVHLESFVEQPTGERVQVRDLDLARVTSWPAGPLPYVKLERVTRVAALGVRFFDPVRQRVVSDLMVHVLAGQHPPAAAAARRPFRHLRAAQHWASGSTWKPQRAPTRSGAICRPAQRATCGARPGRPLPALHPAGARTAAGHRARPTLHARLPPGVAGIPAVGDRCGTALRRTGRRGAGRHGRRARRPVESPGRPAGGRRSTGRELRRPRGWLGYGRRARSVVAVVPYPEPVDFTPGSPGAGESPWSQTWELEIAVAVQANLTAWAPLPGASAASQPSRPVRRVGAANTLRPRFGQAARLTKP
ncbi:MAG: hypothetical protein HZY76_20280 [Anaerolineae bacterium]|nr:MAG: hypothetical protein HZY76_20280 [Anaerolineae bacterium]